MWVTFHAAAFECIHMCVCAYIYVVYLGRLCWLVRVTLYGREVPRVHTYSLQTGLKLVLKC